MGMNQQRRRLRGLGTIAMLLNAVVPQLVHADGLVLPSAGVRDLAMPAQKAIIV